MSLSPKDLGAMPSGKLNRDRFKSIEREAQVEIEETKKYQQATVFMHCAPDYTAGVTPPSPISNIVYRHVGDHKMVHL